jgi:predicted RND superfamily exporter protein
MLSFMAIYIILIVDLKSLKYATLSILPMAMTVVSMLGIMGWTGFKLDVVNIIAVPLIVGIGIDDGVHIIHRYRIEKNLFKTIRSTGKAITLTTLTTMAAFGTLMLSKYRGFVHFSMLITTGVGLAYLMTLFLLFSTLAIVDGIGRKRARSK